LAFTISQPGPTVCFKRFSYIFCEFEVEMMMIVVVCTYNYSVFRKRRNLWKNCLKNVAKVLSVKLLFVVVVVP
jgi:hypothetical protein